ncbi:Gfo/Idh/MocA family oxidoreductase [Kribbella albertanoniae]|uniref:Gfo/Idh/MocA family oxidoreductase n=1 Tax=Kribbella albertanoniae TaxID=1266829 RepID=A0A4R4PA33_9ACTN|nr:Gfo/Idh/MocA family oxidoreductase [Kribbella albertanoniae]TDC17853.1 Gfo/Idh/MocA family oxidoreductase [Kribbella albertanoniae]
MEPLRIGILGAARIAGRAIAEPARLTGARLVAVAARDRDRAEAFAAEHGVERVHASYDDVLADPEVEAIYNPLANALHGPWNLKAIAAGKHVLTEKPSASNASEAALVRDAAAERGVAVMEGFHYLFHPVTRRLHELLAKGELGELQHVETTMVMPPPPENDPRWSLPLAGGALMDVGCYALHAQRSVAPWAGGAPRLVSARAGERKRLPGVDEWLNADLEFPNGATGAVRTSMGAETLDFSCKIIGTRGEAFAPSFVLPHNDDRVIVTTKEDHWVEQLGRKSSYTYQLEAFAAHLRNGAPLPTDADDAVATMQLIDEAYLAAGLSPRPTLAS